MRHVCNVPINDFDIVTFLDYGKLDFIGLKEIELIGKRNVFG